MVYTFARFILSFTAFVYSSPGAIPHSFILVSFTMLPQICLLGALLVQQTTASPAWAHSHADAWRHTWSGAWSSTAAAAAPAAQTDVQAASVPTPVPAVSPPESSADLPVAPIAPATSAATLQATGSVVVAEKLAAGRHSSDNNGGNGHFSLPAASQTVPQGGQQASQTAQYTSQQAAPTTLVTSAAVPATSAYAAPSSGGSSGGTGSCPSGQQYINIENKSGATLYIVSGGSYSVGNCGGGIANGASCSSCSSGSGSLRLGLTPNTQDKGTWIESNTDGSYPATDISIIPGYSVPVECTPVSGGTVSIGFSSPLCTDSKCSKCNAANQGYWDDTLKTCINPTGSLLKSYQDNSLTTLATQGSSYSNLPFFEGVGAGAYYFPLQDQTAGFSVTLGFSEAWWNINCVAYPQA